MNDKAKIDALRAALEDMYNGWRYIRQSHGDLYGVGWDRAEFKARDALALTADAPEQAPDAKVIAKVVSAYGDPEAFGERELIAIADLSTIPYGTNLYAAAPAAPVADTGAVRYTHVGWLTSQGNHFWPASSINNPGNALTAGLVPVYTTAPDTPTASADSAADARDAARWRYVRDTETLETAVWEALEGTDCAPDGVLDKERYARGMDDAVDRAIAAMSTNTGEGEG